MAGFTIKTGRPAGNGPDPQPHHVEMWFDRGSRSLVLQVMNKDGD